MTKLVDYLTITKHLSRIATSLELLVATYIHNSIETGHSPRPDPKFAGDEVEIDYVDPEQEFVDEVKREMGLIGEDEDV